MIKKPQRNLTDFVKSILCTAAFLRKYVIFVSRKRKKLSKYAVHLKKAKNQSTVEIFAAKVDITLKIQK